MANIMLTDKCNLGCQYCFANEFVNQKANEITIANFQKAVEFITRDRTCRHIGLIGGEPTLHSQLKDILEFIINNNQINSCMIYTNAICIDSFVNQIAHPKFRLLINCNSRKDIGESNFNKLDKNLYLLVNERYLRDRITLGFNFYDVNQDCMFFIDLLKKYGFRHARVSVTVPNTHEKRNENSHTYFRKMKPGVKSLFEILISNNIIPHYDCNKIPSCCLDRQDIDELNQIIPPKMLEEIRKTPPGISIFAPLVRCSPVIDILQDLTAVRCFGLSKHTRVNINDFGGIEELYNYYLSEIDSFAYCSSDSKECADCMNMKKRLCMGGCLSFKIDEILKVHSFAQSMMHKE